LTAEEIIGWQPPGQDRYSRIILHYKLLQNLAVEILRKSTHPPAAFKYIDELKDDRIEVSDILSKEKPQMSRVEMFPIQKFWRKKTKGGS